MQQFIENDYIEHWENGVGKITKIDKESVVVDFMNRGKIVVPKERTTYFKKLNPKGLLVQVYEKLEHIQTLIDQESTEIIKYLICDEDESEGRKIERSRVKPLLTKGVLTERGWRRDFGLVDEDDWKKWWTNVNKKLKKDPWFDTSSKSFIALREKPSSKAQNIYERFTAEKQLHKKLSICEQLIRVCKEDEDQSILGEVEKFVTDLIKVSSQAETTYLAVINAIQLSKKGIEIEPFKERANSLILRTLIESKLPTQKLLQTYSFFSNLPIQSIFDHLIVFLHGNRKLREAISSNFRKKNGLQKVVKGKTYGEIITEEQISAVNALKTRQKEWIQSGLVDLVKLIGNKYLTDFLNSLLLSEDIDHMIKETVSNVIIDSRMTSIIYTYLNKIHRSESRDMPFLPEFLNVLGTDNAERSFRHILLNEKTARERPEVFLAAFKYLATDPSLSIDENQKQLLIADVDRFLSNPQIGEFSNLRLIISNIKVDVPALDKVNETLKDSELVNLAKTRLTEFGHRIEAFKLLIRRGLKNECQSIIRSLVIGISEQDFIFLEYAFKSFPDSEFAKELFKMIIEQVDVLEQGLNKAFQSFLKSTDMIELFSESILLAKDDSWHSKYHERITHLLYDEYLIKKIIQLGLKKIMLDPVVPPNILKRLSSYFSPFTKVTLEEMRGIFIENQVSSNKELKRVKDDFAEEIDRMVHEHETKLFDAIDKTSQRYEEYLKRLVPLLQELEMIKDKIRAETWPKKMMLFQDEITNKISLIKEDIEAVLKILEVIDRD
jgi:hypothetical protein